MPDAKVLDFPAQPQDKQAAWLIEPLEGAIAKVLAGELQALVLVGVTEDGTTWVQRHRDGVEMGRMMSLLGGVRLANLELEKDLLEATNGE